MRTYIFKNTLRRALWSPRFLIALSCTIALPFLGRMPWRFEDVLSFMNDTDGFLYITPAFTAIPFAAIFAEDRKSRIQPIIILRCGVDNYIKALAISIIISAFLCCFIGKLIAAYICSLFIPWTSPHSISVFQQRYMGFLLTHQHPIAFLACNRFCEALVCTLESVIAAFLSIYINNQQTIWAAPVIVHFGLTYGMWYAGLPNSVNITRIIEGRLYNGPVLDTILVIGGIGGLCYICSCFFCRYARRSICNE